MFWPVLASINGLLTAAVGLRNPLFNVTIAPHPVHVSVEWRFWPNNKILYRFRNLCFRRQKHAALPFTANGYRMRNYLVVPLIVKSLLLLCVGRHDRVIR